MFKRYFIIFTLTILIGVTIAIVGVYYTSTSNIKGYVASFGEQKKMVIKYYIDTKYKDLEQTYKSHGVWDDTLSALKRKDGEWLSKNAAGYIVDQRSFGVDYILIADEALEYRGQWGGDFERTLLDFVKQSIAKNSLQRTFKFINNNYLFIYSGPVADDKFERTSGIYLVSSIFSSQDKAKLKPILGYNDVDSIEIKEYDNAKMISCKDNILTMDVRILNSPYVLRTTYDLSETIHMLKRQRNRIFVIIIFAALLVYVLILYFLWITSRKISVINQTVHQISEGNYDIEIPINSGDSLIEINALASSINRMSFDIKRHLKTIDENYLEMTSVIVNAVEIKDKYTSEHNLEVANYAAILAKKLDFKEREDLILASKLHDIGKIAISSAILNKPDKLTPEEYEDVKRHSVEGYNIIKDIDYFSHIKLGVKHHHERWDGEGYPDGLKGNDIPFIAQIISLADVYDALTSDRAYRIGMTHEKASAIILENSGKMFNPIIVEAFRESMSLFEVACSHRNLK